MNIVNRKIAEIKPYEENTKKHDKTQIANVAESISQYGFVQPLVIDKDGVVVIGHCRLLAAKKLKMKEVPCVLVDDLTPEQVKALRIVDNKTNESEWDLDLLAEELPEIDLSAFDFDFNIEIEEVDEYDDDNPYTTDINIPQYEILGEKPSLSECYNPEKADKLIEKIKSSNVTEEEKKFLCEAAKRHTVFNFKKIAEYYSAASLDMQELMEDSALVILDYNDAIKKGYVKLNKKLEEMRAKNE